MQRQVTCTPKWDGTGLPEVLLLSLLVSMLLGVLLGVLMGVLLGVLPGVLMGVVLLGLRVLVGGLQGPIVIAFLGNDHTLGGFLLGTVVISGSVGVESNVLSARLWRLTTVSAVVAGEK